MKAFRLAVVVGLVVVAGSRGLGEERTSPTVDGVVAAYEKKVAEIDSEAAAEVAELRSDAVRRLQAVQDRLCRDAKLDEALSVREQIRSLRGEPMKYPQVVALPPDAAEIVAAYEAKVANVERKLTERIEAEGRGAAERLQPTFERLCREAKLDEALAVRDVIRRLDGAAGVEVKPDPGYLSASASQIGEVWYFEVVGANTGSCWGTDVYTTDSSLTAAAVHSGVLEIGEKGVVKVTILPGQSSYPASTRHGITSSSWGSWGVSFKVERAYAVSRPPQGASAVEVKPDPGYLSASSSQIGQVWYFEVVGANTGSCWGTDVYTTDSSLTAAAVHSGVLEIGEKGVVKVTILPGQSNYPASTRHGITSSSWGSWGVSFKVERVHAVVLSSTAEIQVTSGSLSLTAADIGKVTYYEVVGSTDSSPYGTDIYTGDSWLPSAAVHAGALKAGEKGIVRVTVLPGLADYPSTTRHGITSNHWGSYYVSYRVDRVRGRRISVKVGVAGDSDCRPPLEVPKAEPGVPVPLTTPPVAPPPTP